MRLSTAISAVLLVAVLLVARAVTAENAIVYFNFQDAYGDDARAFHPSAFTVLESGSSVPEVGVIQTRDGSMYFDLTVGATYEATFRTPGHYVYTERIVVSPGTANKHYIIPAVQVGAGIVMFSHPMRVWTSPIANMSFPASAGFNFSHTTESPPSGQFNFGAGNPPGKLLHFGKHTYTLMNLQAGVYRYYQNIRESNRPTTNFTTTMAKFTIFGGPDAETGQKVSLNSAANNGVAWYAGDIVVTNPKPGCSRYSWQLVDKFGDRNLFDTTSDNGAGTFLFEDCSNISTPFECTKFVYDDPRNTPTCGAFGDPHVLTFSGVGTTCGLESTLTLIDNNHFSLVAQTVLVAPDTSNATAIKAVTFTYKHPCNPITINFDRNTGVYEGGFNAPFAYRHRVRIYGNNIYVDALHLRIQLRVMNNDIVFGVSMPNQLVDASSGACVDLCPPGTTIGDLPVKRNSQYAQLALDACTDAGIPVGSFEYASCLFDIGTTGITTWADSSAASIEVSRDVATPWETAPLPPDAPTEEEPTPSLPPNDEEPSPSLPPNDEEPSPSLPPNDEEPSPSTPPVDGVPSSSSSITMSVAVIALCAALAFVH